MELRPEAFEIGGQGFGEGFGQGEVFDEHFEFVIFLLVAAVEKAAEED